MSNSVILIGLALLAGAAYWTGKQRSLALVGGTRGIRKLHSLLEDTEGIRLLGPAQCPLGRLKDRWRWHLLLKAESSDILRTSLRRAFSLMTSTDRFGMTTDIDPLSLL